MMNVIFKILLVLLLPVAIYFHSYAQLYPQIDYEDVDSITIKMIGYTTTAHLQIDRNNFDLEYAEYRMRNSDWTTYIKFTDKVEIMMFVLMLNNLKAYPKEDVKLLPNEIKINKDDPIEVKAKIKIYTSSMVITAFAATYAIDIFNYRYETWNLGLALFDLPIYLAAAERQRKRLEPYFNK